jgi:hypothetical protein
MAKQGGMGAAYFVDGYNLSGDSREFKTISKSMKPLEVPGIDASSMERIAGKLDGLMAWVSYFNTAALHAHAALKAPPRTDRVASYLHRQTLGVPMANMVCKQTNYDPSRADAGDFVFDIEALANDFWLDWGWTLTAGVRADTGATNGTGVDFGAAGTFGLQAYLHVTGFTGTSATIKLQQSSDNGAGDAFADVTGGAFTVVSTSPQGQAIYTARNLAVERYLRVVTTGTFSALSFVAGATVNETDMTI